MEKNLSKRSLQFIEQQALFKRDDHLLLACSGGSDSMLLAQLLLEEQFIFSIAHANFQLRGKDAEEDEKFVKDFCAKNNIPFFVQRFNKEDSLQKGESTQMWARRVRYDWFHELIQEHSFHYLLTAHHADDSLETFMMQFLRGISPFTYPGIRCKRDYVRRPLLFARKEELLAWGQEKKIAWREDKSNQENDYERNKMRNAILPLLKQYRGDSEEQLFGMLEEMQQKHLLWMMAFEEFSKKIAWVNSGKVQTLLLKEHQENRMLYWYLYSSLLPLGFQSSQIDDLFKGIREKKSGLLFYGGDLELLLDREQLLLREKTAAIKEQALMIHEPGQYRYGEMEILCSMVMQESAWPVADHCLLLEENKFHFPLLIRQPQEGEKMQPFGLKGNKKISDLLVDHKVDRFTKERSFVLCNEKGEILWLAGIRKSELTRVEGRGGAFIKFEILG